MIFGCVGRGGSGKSLTTVGKLWRIYKRGREIISNTPLVDLRVKWDNSRGMWLPVDAETFGESWASQYIYTFDEIRNLDNCEVFIDEAGSWMPAHAHRTMPEEMRAFIAQDRREGVNIHWTHRTERVWIDLRENTAEISRNSRFGPLIVQTIRDPEEPKEKWRKFDFVSPMKYDLYQTFARVGSAATGTGYGLGTRTGYKSGGATGDLITIRHWTPHNLDIRVRRNQFECLMRKFGPDALGIQRDDNGLRQRWRIPTRGPVPKSLDHGPVRASIYRGES